MTTFTTNLDKKATISEIVDVENKSLQLHKWYEIVDINIYNSSYYSFICLQLHPYDL